MRGYGQYCPIALAAEVFAERWTPIIIRNLSLGCERFTDLLDGAPGLPRSVLSQRLRVLERTGIVHRTQAGRATAYTLTESGRELADLCLELGAWGARWREVRPEDQDPYLSLWIMSRMIAPDSLPQPRVVVQVHVTGHPAPNRFWLVLSTAGNEVCAEPPGYPEDGRITTDTATLVRWCAGEVPLGLAQRGGSMDVVAPAWLLKRLAAWGRLSPYAGTVRRDPHATTPPPRSVLPEPAPAEVGLRLP